MTEKEEKNNRKKIESYLKDTLSNINYWLAFAEAKNAAIIGLNIAMLGLVADFISSKSQYSIFGFYLIGAGLILSLFFSLLSFFPNLNSDQDDVHQIIKDRDNLLFYGDICRYSASEYIQALYKQYCNVDIDCSEISKYELDYANEIIINSKITMVKYKLFKYALIIDVILIVFILVALILA